jgi:Leucine-rich repeat (LRR) protein
MKKFYTLIGIAVLSFSAQAQVVNIPDVNFKAALLNDDYINTNQDTEIQLSEALNATVVNASYQGIVNLTGLEAFVNITELSLPGNNLSGTIDVSYLHNLLWLDCSSNQLTGINLAGMAQLERLVCSLNNLTSLNLGGLTNLNALDITRNPSLPFPDLTGLNNLISLTCMQSAMTSLNISNLPQLQYLNCRENGLTSLNLSNLPHLTALTCAQNALTTLNLNGFPELNSLNCEVNQLTSLTLTNPALMAINCNNNHLTSLQISTLGNLNSLNCSGNDLSSLSINNLVGLEFLQFDYNHFSAIDISNLTNLRYLNFDNNLFTSFDFSPLVNLEQLGCNYNQLSVLDVSHNPLLNSLQCHHNQLTEVNFGNGQHLVHFYANDNLFTSLDLSALQVVALDTYFYNNPNLTYVNFKNGALYFLSFGSANCPNLQYVCVEEDAIATVMALLEIDGNESVLVNSYCSSSPGGVFNTISGTATIDSDNNGCDTNDFPVAGIKVNLNDGMNVGAAISNMNGAYGFFTQQGNFTVTPQFENPYFNCSPASATVNFSAVDGSVLPQNFCITPLGMHNDLEITIIPLTALRPGFDANFQLVYKNKGTHVVPSGSVSLSFVDSLLDLVTAEPMPDSQAADIMNWNYANLNPFETRTINFTVNLNGPTETPPANIDDVIHFLAVVNPTTGDEIIHDNTFELTQTVVGSFDPNDKTCLNGTYIDPEMIGDFLHYLIRFQNTGTAPAENIVIKDAIDLSKFDISTLQMVTASHPYETHIESDHVEFIFNGIQLPGGVNNPLSHGFVSFKIKTKVNLPVGSSVSNKADIFFDYNFPITTNTVTSHFSLLGTTEFNDSTVAVYPNPVKDRFSISAKDTITSVQLYDVLGRQIQALSPGVKSLEIDLSQQNNGIYLVKINTEKGIKTQKIIKQ